MDVKDIIAEYQFDDIDLKTAVDALPARLRDLIILQLCGYTHKEMGDYIDRTRSMASKLVTAALRILKDIL